MPSQKENLAKFRALHAPGNLLVLPNAWDAASARMVQELGAQAVATSSAAVAWANGYADGETMPRDVILAATRAVMRVTRLPVSVDSEAGYSSDLAQVAAHVMALIELGVVGINLEDGRDPPDLLATKIRAIKAAAKATGVDVFINARSDVYLRELLPQATRLGEILRRGRLYRDAGADGFFAPFVTDPSDIRQIVAAVDLPLNILMRKDAPPIAALKEAGARRVSAGALIGRAAYGAAARATRMVLDEGRYDAIFATSGDCPDFNRFFSPSP